jgi:predicted small lipoprotein YifL
MRSSRVRHVILQSMRTASLFAVAVLTVSGVACGQKGPLVLPDAQHPHKKLGLQKPAGRTAPGTPAAPGSTGEPQASPVPQQ